MSAEDCVDAALSGLQQGETVTIAGLQNYEDWQEWEDARKSLSNKFGNAKPSPRYS